MRRRAGLVPVMLLAAVSAWAAGAALESAQQQFNAGKYTAAIRGLQTAVAQAPQQAALYYWLARCFYELHDYPNAVAQAERAIKLDPNDSECHLWLGRAYGRQAERERSFWLARKTKHEFEEAVRLNGRNLPARRDLMEFYATAPWVVGGSKEKAQEQLSAIAAQDQVEGALARAEYDKDQKRYDLAEGEYRRVMDWKPDHPNPYLEVADFYARKDDPTQMNAAVEAAARVDPTDQRLPYYRGVVLVLTANRLSEAEQDLKAYLASMPERSDLPSHAQAREWLGRLYERVGKRIEAAEQYRAALQLDPTLVGARASLERLEKQSN
jgi:tetratricopeptide (TPR) repeat protein